MARLRIRWRQYVAFGLGGLALGTTALWSQERTPNAAIRVADPGAFQLVGGKAGEQPPAKTIQPPTTEANQPPASSPQPPSPTSTGDSAFDRLMRGGFAPPSTGGGGTAAAGGGGEVSASQAQQASSNPAANVVSGGEAATRATTDTGDLLGKSLSSVGVIVQRRNPIVSAPIIRGYRFGQLGTYADGAFWTPARPDLDTIVSKIDSSDIANIVVIKDPYSVRHGAAF